MSRWVIINMGRPHAPSICRGEDATKLHQVPHLLRLSCDYSPYAVLKQMSYDQAQNYSLHVYNNGSLAFSATFKRHMQCSHRLLSQAVVVRFLKWAGLLQITGSASNQ